MTDFKHALNQFIEHKIELDQLEQTLKNDLKAQPEAAAAFLTALSQLSEQQIIAASVAAQLSNIINASSNGGAGADAFPQLLKAFQAHEIGYRGLEKGLIADLSADPDKHSLYINALNNLSAKGVITKPVFADLMAAIDEHFGSLVAEPAAPVEAVEVKAATPSNLFAAELTQFLAHKISYPQLEAALSKAMVADEPDCEVLLQAELAKGTLQQVVFDSLLQLLHPDEDKTQIRSKKAPISAVPAEDDDKTQIRVTAKDSTSRTSNTNTSTGTRTGTLSTWSKPFEQTHAASQIGIGTVLKGRFQITEFIGHGGMGDVFKAEDLRNVEAQDAESEIAVKVLNKEFREHQDSLKSLQREAKKTRQLAHPHIVNVFDFDRDEHNVFMTMELMVGDPLDKAIKKTPEGFPLDEVFKYVREMGSALEYAHTRGVIHCDLKPGNIFLSSGEVKVFDFGIARAAKSGAAGRAKQDDFDAGDIGALTPSYASPEMLDDLDDPEPQDDIYALGCITYELLTGSHPFVQDKKKVPANKAKALGLQPKRIETLKSWQWEALKGCLAFDREQRTVAVNLFTDEFLLLEKPISPKMKMAAAAVVVGLGLGGYFGWEYKKQADVNSFVALVNGSQHEVIKQRLKDLIDADKDEQQRYFNDSKGETVLINYFLTQVKTLSDKDEHELGAEVVALAQAVYGRLTDISKMTQAFDKSRSKRIAELDAALVNLLNSETFVDDYPQLKGLWDTLKRVDRDNSKLSDTGTALELEDGIEHLMGKEQFVRADQLADFSLALLAQNSVFADQLVSIERLKASISGHIDNDQINKQIDQLENRLLNFDQTTTLAAYQAELTTIEDLRNIAPDNEVLSALLKVFNGKFDHLLASQIEAVQWQAAGESVSLYEPILTDSEFNQYSEKVAAAKLKFDDQTNALVRQITIISDSATPDKAQVALNNLIKHQADEATVAAAKDIIAKGWLKQAKKASAQQDWSGARQAIQSGLAMASGDSIKTALQSADSNLATAQAAGSSQLSEAEQQRQLVEKTQAITALAKQIRQQTQVTAMSIEQATQTLKSIDDLEVLEQTHGLIDSGKDKIIELLLANGTALVDSDLTQALAFSNEAYKLMPTAEKLGSLVVDITARINADKDSQKQAQLASLAQQIDSLLKAENFHEKAAELEQKVKEYEQSAADKTYSNTARSSIAQRFVSHAQSLKEQQRFDEAISAMSNAKRFDGSNLKQVNQQIVSAKADYDKNKAQQRQQAKSASLKQSFAVQIKAQDVKLAEATLAALKAQGGNDEFVNSTGKTQLLNMLNKLIEQATQKGDLTSAISWQEKQINYALDVEKSKADLARFQTAQNIKVAATVNPDNAKTLLATALQQYPEDPLIRALEQQLGQTDQSSTTTSSTTSTTVAQSRFPSDQQCVISMAGRGKSTRQTCYDKVDAKSKGPRMVVLPKLDGNHFAISRYEITIGDYNTYCKASGACSPITGQSKLLPVTNLSLDVMQAYSAWLSKVTGERYQLPTYAQWQFAANGKSNSTTQSYKNCKAYSSGALVRGIEMQKVSFNSKKSRNSWGLTHYLGNASEVVQSDSGWAAVGGSWNDEVANCTIANQDSVSGKLDEFTGFRLVRKI